MSPKPQVNAAEPAHPDRPSIKGSAKDLSNNLSQASSLDTTNDNTATTDAHLVERVQREEHVFKGGFLHVVRQHVRTPAGHLTSREYIRHPGAVMILPLLPQGKLLLERQWRTPMRRVMLEFPAGKLDAGEHWFDCAVRELREECGLRAREWAFLTDIHNAIAYSDEVIHLLVARDFEPLPQQLDEHEHIELVEADFEQVLAWVQDGSISDVKTIIGTLWLDKVQSGAWPLRWVSASEAAAQFQS